MYGNPLPTRDLTLVDDRPERSGETTAEAGSCFKGKLIGQVNQIDIRMSDSNILGK